MNKFKLFVKNLFEFKPAPPVISQWCVGQLGETISFYIQDNDKEEKHFFFSIPETLKLWGKEADDSIEYPLMKMTQQLSGKIIVSIEGFDYSLEGYFGKTIHYLGPTIVEIKKSLVLNLINIISVELKGKQISTSGKKFSRVDDNFWNEF